MTTQRCAISVDLDDLACYYRIHGLGDPPPELASVILECALPRAAALFARHGVPATWFVVGRDVELPSPGSAGAPAGSSGPAGSAGEPAGSATTTATPERLAARAALLALHRAGHELGNHSYSHPYHLARLTEAEIAVEIDACDRVLRELTGTPVLGFRAPGYDLSPTVLRTLSSRRYRYDSSILPAPAYYLAKVAVMGALALRQQPSGAVLTDPRALLAPRRPYRPAAAAPWRRGQSPVVELPITVTPGLRVPVIGTALLLSPPRLCDRLLSAISDEPVFNLELHGIDFADAERDGIPGELVAHQPDLRLPAAVKLARLDSILSRLAQRFTFTTLAELAAATQREQ